MERWLGKYSEMFYALMRLVVGLLFAFHGAQKLFGVFGGQGLPADPLIVAAGVIEFVGGGLVALGLWAGYAAFVSQRPDGRGLFYGTRIGWLLADRQQGRARGSVLLRLSFYRLQGVGPPEPRRD